LRKNEKDERTKYSESELKFVEQESSLPYSLPFHISVFQASVGLEFAALLTVEGEVFTFGHNLKGQLG